MRSSDLGNGAVSAPSGLSRISGLKMDISALEARVQQEAIKRSKLSWDLYSQPGLLARDFVLQKSELADEAELIKTANQARKEVGAGAFFLGFPSADAAAALEPTLWPSREIPGISWPVKGPWKYALPYLSYRKLRDLCPDPPPKHVCRQSRSCVVVTEIVARPGLKHCNQSCDVWVDPAISGLRLQPGMKLGQIPSLCSSSFEKVCNMFAIQEFEFNRLEFRALKEDWAKWEATLERKTWPPEVFQYRFAKLCVDIAARPDALAQAQAHQGKWLEAQMNCAKEMEAVTEKGGILHAPCQQCGRPNLMAPYACSECKPPPPVVPSAQVVQRKKSEKAAKIQALNDVAAAKKRGRDRVVPMLSSLTHPTA
jgi:hypothetical protein